MTVTDLPPSEIFRVVGELSSELNARRAIKAIDACLRERGHGGGVELQNALGISRSSFTDWRNGKVKISPATVYRVAVIYTQPEIPTSPDQVDAAIAAGSLTDADHLFHLFYSDNHRDAVTWLIEHRPGCFAWNNVDHGAMVA